MPRTLLPAVLLAIAALATASPVSSARTQAGINLGKLTDDTLTSVDIARGFHEGYRRVGGVLRHAGKLEVLLFDTLWDGGSAADRWSLVKALAQFGAWSGVKTGQSTEPVISSETGTPKPPPAVPTLDLSHASYHSSYVALVHRVLQTHHDDPIASLPPAETALLKKVLAQPQVFAYNLPYAAVVVGAYAMHGAAEDPTYIAFAQDVSGTWRPVTPQQMQSDMRAGDASRFWVRDLNVFTNVTVAVVCKQDGMRPAGVCNRRAIKAIVKTLP